MPPDKVDVYMNKIQSDSSFKGAFGRSFLRVIFNNLRKPRHLRDKICNEVFLTIPVVIYSQLDYFLLDKLNEKIEMLQAAGLIEFWHYKGIDKRILNDKDLNVLKVLKVNDFMGCFQTILAGWLCGVIVLAFEVIINLVLIRKTSL